MKTTPAQKAAEKIADWLDVPLTPHGIKSMAKIIESCLAEQPPEKQQLAEIQRLVDEYPKSGHPAVHTLELIDAALAEIEKSCGSSQRIEQARDAAQEVRKENNEST